MAHAAERLAAHIVALRYEDLDAATVALVKRLLLDYLGVALAGSATDSGRIAARYAASDGGQAQASLFGGGRMVPAKEAAFANAISAHSIELDDTDITSSFHYSPPVYSAALACAEWSGASGKELIVALALGCEIMQRASEAVNPSMRNRCFHTTAACGVFGAAASACRLLGLSADQSTHALALAGAQASGVLEFHGPSMQKRFSPGPASRGGLTAAGMALLGYTGQTSIFEGDRGFLKAYSDDAHPDRLTAGLGEPFRLAIEFKPYSCARPIHNGIDCALEIRTKAKPSLERIRSIDIARHPEWAHKHLEFAPATFHAAQLSLPYSVAVALKEGQALLPQYNEPLLSDRAVARLMGVTTITKDPALPRGVSCRMTITMEDGSRHVSQVDYPKGSMEVPMTDADLEAKFMTLAVPVLGEGRAAGISSAVRDIEQCADVAGLMTLAR